MASRASKILNLFKEYESGKSEKSQLHEQLNRPKDRAKVDLLANNDEVKLDISRLQQILSKYKLT
ncbi:MAG: hypothetical protein ACE5I1_22955, partial [bacterium]